MRRGRALVVDDLPENRELLAAALEPLGIDVLTSASASEGLAVLVRDEVDVVVTDLVMPEMSGLDLLAEVNRRGYSVPCILVSAYADLESVERSWELGAFEFVARPVDREVLASLVRRALLKRGLMAERLEPRPPLPVPPLRLPNLVGESRAMQEVYATIARVATTDATVCIYGESGTGKELAARALHYLSARREGPLVVLDSAAIPEGLMESEMFGHVKGAFTSAASDREGVFQLANKGTLFLDEVGELSLPLQAKLLRVIQSREFRKVGGTKPIQVDVRLIAATNKDLQEMVAAGTFREDLFYRLHVIPIRMPPLRERQEDIPLLVAHFLERFNRNSKVRMEGISSRTMRLLMQYDWPGNVRELENCIERAAVMAEGEVIDVGDLAMILRGGPGGGNGRAGLPPAQATTRLADLEREHILAVLGSVGGNKRRAAELLGISLRGLYYKLKEYERMGWPIPSVRLGAPASQVA
jgi:DNA-binding NtrC family response regulator